MMVMGDERWLKEQIAVTVILNEVAPGFSLARAA